MEPEKVKMQSQQARYVERDEFLLSAASGGDQAVVEALLAQGVDLMAADKKGRTALHLASRNGHYSTVKALLQKRASVEAKDDGGRTALGLAAENGHCEVAWCLWKHDAKISRRDYYKRTPLHIAALNNHVGMVLMLLAWGCNVGATDEEGRTPLALVSRLGHEVLAEILLRNKADPNSTDRNGWTSLHFAVHNGFVSLASLLIENGANPGIATDRGETIVSLAASSGNEEMKQLCTEKESSPTSKAPKTSEELGDESDLGYESLASLQLVESSTEASTVFDPSEVLASALSTGDASKIPRLVRMGAHINRGRSDGMTALMLCASWGELGLLELLLREGASIDATDNTGRTALWWAVSHCIEQTARILLEHGAAVDLADSNQLTPLVLAALRGRTAIARLLVQHGANVNSRDKEGRTPLWWAVEYGQESTVAFLLDSGAVPDLSTDDGTTPLCHAAASGHSTIVRLFLQKGAGINLADARGRTPLSHAAEAGHEVVIETLLNQGATLNSQDVDNRTALTYAAENGHGMAVELLIDAGAQLDLKDKNGANPLSLAVGNDHQETVHLLSQAAFRQRVQQSSDSSTNIGVFTRPLREPYQYQTLSEGSKIRLMELHPGDRNDTLSFNLQEIDLADRPLYEALSYEWGAKVGTILVKANGGRILRITPNLKAALRRLRLPKESRLLWVDAVCINQDDIAERNRQVSMMTDIYRSAQIVIFWIGEQDAYTQVAFSVIPALFRAWQVLKSQPSTSSTSPLEFDVKFVDSLDHIPELKQLLAGLVPYSPAFRGLENIFLNTYFTRAWILQEIMLATQAVVLCGRFHCDWEIFRKALIALFHCKDAIGMPLVNSSAVNILKFHEAFKTGQWALEQALVKVMLEFKASDPRDKIYATLGLATLASPSRKPPFVPDYNFSVQEVYTNAARHFIEESGRLSCWEGCNTPRTKQIQGLPSWVPDWTITNKITFAEDRQSPWSVEFSTPNSKAQLIAGQPTTTEKCLYVNSCILDRVVGKLPLTSEREGLDIVLDAVGILASLGHDVFGTYPDPMHNSTETLYLDLLWRTLQWNEDQHGEPHVDILGFLAWNITSRDASPSSYEDLPKRLQQRVRRCEQLAGQSQHYELKIHDELEQRLQCPADLIVTEKGFLGIASSGAVEEDMVIALLGGARELSLLRERRDSGAGDAWYEYVDKMFMDHWRGPVESLEDVEGDAVIRRLEIR
jgi:ankyrin repeat protein